ncbi:MAG: hypothetical protein GTN62_03085 [Gemmatimonadales bacterium]|nr:hypothetical protein [Gemmatimonadales bacterium]NIN49084.1 hypothetical protein [Gemmatimonadales bacterium]NIP06548.1 hypothetical protein [Gemmatimonadales bacterium]NIR00245.1 hypothetical protein [Gemmatimonadales bacterium]NIS64578.1 hypothetical protein [Gemmatimonadales bacterium]
MKCRECQLEMNHHADKPVDPASAEEARGVDPALGAIVEAVHCCPECGSTESERIAPGLATHG